MDKVALVSDAITPPSRQRFALKADIPVRAYLIAAISSSLGAFVVILWAWVGLPSGVLVAGAVLMIFGAALVLVAFVISKQLRSVLTLDASACVLTRGKTSRTLQWSEIVEVRLAGPRMIIMPKPGGHRPMQVVNPGGSSATTFLAAAEAIRMRLDADRGYRNVG